jgi:hypothetical protein
VSDHAAYDALDTVRWMISETAAERARETTTDAAGRSKKKSKAQRERDDLRFDTLCEVLWNVTGRTATLEDVKARAANGAA